MFDVWVLSMKLFKFLNFPPKNVLLARNDGIVFFFCYSTKKLSVLFMCALSVLLLLLLIEWKLSHQGDESTTNAPLLLPFRTILYRLYKVLGGRKPISFFPSIIFFCRRIHFLFVAIQHMFQYYYQAFIYLVKKPYNWIADGKFSWKWG